MVERHGPGYLDALSVLDKMLLESLKGINIEYKRGHIPATEHPALRVGRRVLERALAKRSATSSTPVERSTDSGTTETTAGGTTPGAGERQGIAEGISGEQGKPGETTQGAGGKVKGATASSGASGEQLDLAFRIIPLSDPAVRSVVAEPHAI